MEMSKNGVAITIMRNFSAGRQKTIRRITSLATDELYAEEPSNMPLAIPAPRVEGAGLKTMVRAIAKVLECYP
jgi:hypothetical protein